MPILSKRNTVILAIVLSVMMWVTRNHHAMTLTHLPDASWAIFFLLGFYFRERMILPLFLAQAAIIDYLSITQFGTSDYCVTSAYAFLLPAYFMLWLAGKWYVARYQFHVRTLPLFAAAALTGTALCELISSGSFYFLGGHFADTSLSEFALRFAQYFPFSLGYIALYLGCAASIHILLVSAQRPSATAQ